MTRRRADAVYNRTLLLEAAEAVFLEMGVNAPLDLIAERAGVGRATLFRNFADRREILVALLDYSLVQAETKASELSRNGQALIELLRFLAGRVIYQAPMVEFWLALGRDSEESRCMIRRLLAMFREPVEWAVEAGACRSDLTVDDIVIFGLMNTAPLFEADPEKRGARADRAWAFLVEILQP
jgi:AcrR family transcriptional regulator